MNPQRPGDSRAPGGTIGPRVPERERQGHLQTWLSIIEDANSIGQDYITCVKPIALRMIAATRQFQPGSTGLIEAQRQAKRDLEARQKALNRSNINRQPWFAPLATQITARIRSTKSQFTKWLGQAILTGDPSQMPEILRPSPGAVEAAARQMQAGPQPGGQATSVPLAAAAHAADARTVRVDRTPTPRSRRRQNRREGSGEGDISLGGSSMGSQGSPMGGDAHEHTHEDEEAPLEQRLVRQHEGSGRGRLGRGGSDRERLGRGGQRAAGGQGGRGTTPGASGAVPPLSIRRPNAPALSSVGIHTDPLHINGGDIDGGDGGGTPNSVESGGSENSVGQQARRILRNGESALDMGGLRGHEDHHSSHDPVGMMERRLGRVDAPRASRAQLQSQEREQRRSRRSRRGQPAASHNLRSLDAAADVHMQLESMADAAQEGEAREGGSVAWSLNSGLTGQWLRIHDRRMRGGGSVTSEDAGSQLGSLPGTDADGLSLPGSLGGRWEAGSVGSADSYGVLEAGRAQQYQFGPGNAPIPRDQQQQQQQRAVDVNESDGAVAASSGAVMHDGAGAGAGQGAQVDRGWGQAAETDHALGGTEAVRQRAEMMPGDLQVRRASGSETGLGQVRRREDGEQDEEIEDASGEDGMRPRKRRRRDGGS